MHESEKWKWSRLVVSDSSRPHGLQPTRLLRPWDPPSKSTGVGCHRLRGEAKEGATVHWSTVRSHLDVRTRIFLELHNCIGLLMEIWKADRILICKRRKTACLSIHLGSSYDVCIAYILDQGDWDINTYSIIMYQWKIKSDKNKTRNAHFLTDMLYLSWLCSSDMLYILL